VQPRQWPHGIELPPSTRIRNLRFFNLPPPLIATITLAGALASVPSVWLYEYTGTQNKASCVEALVAQTGIDLWKAEDKCCDADSKNNDRGANWLFFTLLLFPLLYVLEKMNRE
jgi:hypothetical protein